MLPPSCPPPDFNALLIERDAELAVLVGCCPFLGIQEASRRRFVDSAVLFFEVLEGVDQFPDAGIALEGQRLEDGPHPILDPDRL